MVVNLAESNCHFWISAKAYNLDYILIFADGVDGVNGPLVGVQSMPKQAENELVLHQQMVV